MDMASSIMPKSDELLLQHLQGINSSKYFDFLCNERSIPEHMIDQTLFSQMTYVFYHAHIINHNEIFREFYMFCRSMYGKQNAQSYAVLKRNLLSWIDEKIVKLCRSRKTFHLKKVSSFPIHIFHTISDMVFELLLHLNRMENDYENSSEKTQSISVSLLNSLMKLNALSPSLSSQKKRRQALKSVEFFDNKAEDYTYLGGNINPTHLLSDIKQDIKVWSQKYYSKLSLNCKNYPSSQLSQEHIDKIRKSDDSEQQNQSKEPISILKKPPVLALTVNNLKIHAERWSENELLVNSLSYQRLSSKQLSISSDKRYLLKKMAVTDFISNVLPPTISCMEVADNWFQTDSSSIDSCSSSSDLEDTVNTNNISSDVNMIASPQQSIHNHIAKDEIPNSASDHSPTTEITLGHTADGTDDGITFDPETSDILAQLQEFSINENTNSTNLNANTSKFFTNNFNDSDTDESIIFDPSTSSPMNIVIMDNDWSNEEIEADFLCPMSSSPDLIESLSQTADYFYEELKEEVSPEFEVCITLQSSIIQTVNCKWSEFMMGVDDTEKTPSKVSFAPDDNLCQVHVFDLFEQDLFSTSEILDQLRFKQRIKDFESIVTPFLTTDHRNKVCQRNSIYIDEMF